MRPAGERSRARRKHICPAAAPRDVGGAAAGSAKTLVAMAFAAMALAWARPLRAQPDARQALVTVTAAPESVAIGERFAVRIRVRAPKIATVTFPAVPAGTEAIEPVDPRAMADGLPGDAFDMTAIYTFAAWSAGTHTPEFDPLVVAVAGREQRFAVIVPPVVVRSLLPGDTTKYVPRGARDPVRLPGRSWQYALLLAIVLVALGWWWRTRRVARTAADSRRAREAWADVGARLAALDALDLVHAGEPGRHAMAHVDVLRSYVARRFPSVGEGLDARDAVAGLGALDFPLPVSRIATLLDRDAGLRFARSPVRIEEAEALAREARDIAALIQEAHEARLRALERPPRPRRR